MKISHLVWCSLLAVSSLAAQNLQVAPMVQPPSGTIQVVPQVKKPEAKALQAQAPLVTKITVEAERAKAKAAPSVQPVVKNRQTLKPFAVAPHGQGKGLPLATAAPQAMPSVKVRPDLMPSALLPGAATAKSARAEEADEVPNLVYLDEGFTVSPLPANPGSPLEIKATIKNTGSNAYTGRLYAALVTLDGESNITNIPYISDGTAVGLPAGQIPLVSLNRADELMSAFNAGEVTLMDVDLTGTSALGSSGRYQVWDYNATQLLYLGFNTRQGLCRDPEVRRGIARAIDRDYISDTILARHAISSALPVHPDSPWYDQALAGELSYAPASLEGLGLEGRPLTLAVNIENTAKSAAATYIAQQLERAGLVVSVERLPWADYLDALSRGRFDLYLGEVYLTPDFDLTPLVGTGGGLNYGGWSSGATESYLSAFRASQGTGRQAAASALYRHLCQQVPIAPICFRSGTVLTQYGRVEGLSPVYGNLFSGLENWVIS